MIDDIPTQPMDPARYAKFLWQKMLSQDRKPRVDEAAKLEKWGSFYHGFPSGEVNSE